METIITRRKCGSGSLVLFLIRHVLSLASAFSSRKLMSSLYWMMHTCIIRKNSIASHTKRYNFVRHFLKRLGKATVAMLAQTSIFFLWFHKGYFVRSSSFRYHCALVFVSILQGRLFSYHGTHLHRLGTNYLQLPFNSPYKTRVCNNQRDGPQTFYNQSRLSLCFNCDTFWTSSWIWLIQAYDAAWIHHWTLRY